ncbi:MAG: hypothetical protein GC185_12850 [Alphaproteobacteria bacterium]|nr:hypothetical protein [Alphaproteobacteria bacterium]
MLKSNAPLPKNDQKLSLSHVFNTEVRKAMKDFPELDGKFLLIDTENKVVHGKVDPSVARVDQNQLDDIIMKVAEGSERAHSSLATKLDRVNLDVMAYTPLPFKLFTGKDDPGEMEAMAVFDHELGHLVVRGGYYSEDPCFRECAADSFAVLRHIQRYGDKSEAIERAGWRRAFDFVMSGDAGHFTTLAIDEIAHIKDDLDIAAMTPEQTAKLAMRVSLEHTPHPDITEACAASFAPVRKAMQQTRSLETGMALLAEIALANDSAYYTYKIASRVLKPFIEGKVQVPGQTFDGKKWEDIRTRMEDRQKQFDSEGILFGMPTKKKAPDSGKPGDNVVPFKKPAPPRDPRHERFIKRLV